MNKNVITDNIASFIFVLLLFSSALGSAFIYVFLEYKKLQQEKIDFHENKLKSELEFIKVKHDLELEIKNFEIQKTKYNSNNELTKSSLIDNINLKVIKCEEILQNYKYQSDTLFATKNIEIQNLEKELYEQKKQFNDINTRFEKIKEKNILLEESIKKMNIAEKITQLISEYAKNYSSISKNNYEKYSDYIEASRQFEAIQGLINVYHLEKEYEDFIRLVSKRMYIHN